MSISARAVSIQITLVYILIESPLFTLLKEKQFITMAFVVLVQHMKMFTCASKILLRLNLTQSFLA